MLDLEDYAHSPSGGKWKQNLGGVLVPLLFIGYGIYCMITRTAIFPSYRSTIRELMIPKGEAAVWMGITFFFMVPFYISTTTGDCMIPCA